MHHPSTRRGLAAAFGLAIAGSTALVALAPQVQAASTGTNSTYIVVYNDGTSSAGAASAVSKAGGTVVANYTQIGVVIAQSASTGFAGSMSKATNVSGVSATAKFAVRDVDNSTDAADSTTVTPNTPTSGDTLSGLQWDMAQIHAPEAQAVQPGSSNVVVGDIDTGLDWTHPDLAPNVDFSRSVSCVGGVPNTDPNAWMDDNGHGTHTAGTIAAAANGIGIVGVAPGVKLAGIKAGDAAGFFFPESVVCAFMWAGTHGIAVTNNSYFADPWLFNCKNDATQRAIWTAERRAIQFAQSMGTLVVAAEGNQADDLSHPVMDSTSPDNTTPVSRTVTNACAVVPVEVPGVVGVSATGNLHMKSFYSSYGISTVDVAAPGGDSILQRTAASPNGRVLSTWPASLLNVTCLPARRVVDPSGATYCYQQGTSMASPHAAGVAALIASQQGGSSAGAGSVLGSTATPTACPSDTSAYDFFPSVDDGRLQTCSGGIGHNSWFGSGEIDALAAVSH